MAITQQRIKELLDYDGLTGLLRWKVERRCGEFNSVVVCKKGDKAGGLRPDGYLSISIDHKRYQVHRIIWMHVFGEMPAKDMDIDHIDGNRSNNAISNLRLANRSQNHQNLRGPKVTNKTSGVLGVYFEKKRNKWRARLNINKKTIDLGFYEHLDDAKKAREAGVKKYFTHSPLNF
jgi:hypothetical protein